MSELRKWSTEMRNPLTLNIDRMSTSEMADCIQRENENAAAAVGKALPEIEKACDRIAAQLADGGRLIYIGSGSSGRLGVLDAVECPPTYGVPPEMVVGIIAGGPACMFRASEGEEDNGNSGIRDLRARNVTNKDVVVGISASGNADYVAAALKEAGAIGCVTVAVTSNPGSMIALCAEIAIVTETGPEVITGSTRMKAGTAQKMVLNMLSTMTMVKLGFVYENLMINLKPGNKKLTQRMIGIVCEITKAEECDARRLLEENGWSIRKAIEARHINRHAND